MTTRLDEALQMRLAWDSAAAPCHEALRAALEAAGMAPGNLDMLVAAHALSMGVIFVTDDQAFARAPALVVENRVSS